jgi:hypothetical protein
LLGVMHMFKLTVLVFFVILISACASKGIEPVVYKKGKYRTDSFEYPSTLRATEIEYIVDEINKLSEDKIGKISLARDYRYDVMVCSVVDHSIDKLPYCRNPQLYRFGYGHSGFTNFQITPHPWHDFPLYEFRFEKHENHSEYSHGKYRDIPISYPSTISKQEIKNVVAAIEDVSSYEIGGVLIKDEETLEIGTCKLGSRLPNHCETGESILYDRVTIKVIEKTCCWIQ